MPTDVEVYEALALRIEVDRDGTCKYFNSAGELHRDNGPAVEYKSGSRAWFQNGKLHRTDGPAVVWSDGEEVWFQNGLRHREGGPAVITPDGRKEWWIDGAEYSEHEYHTALKTQGRKHDK